MLALPELELEFYRRYLERRLLSYRSRGTPAAPASDAALPEQGRAGGAAAGPFIVCVDTSGSMGAIRRCAKALFLALLKGAMEEKQGCYLMLFSTEVATLEITADTGLEKAERFLSMSFHGGTDLVPCLEQALTQLEQPAFAKADVLVISDFIARTCPTPARADEPATGAAEHASMRSPCPVTPRRPFCGCSTTAGCSMRPAWTPAAALAAPLRALRLREWACGRGPVR